MAGEDSAVVAGDIESSFCSGCIRVSVLCSPRNIAFNTFSTVDCSTVCYRRSDYNPVWFCLALQRDEIGRSGTGKKSKYRRKFRPTEKL